MTTPSSATTSTTGSPTPSANSVRAAIVVTHGKPETIGPALETVRAVAERGGVALAFPPDEREKHDIRDAVGDEESADLVVVLGGDGTMLRTIHRFLDRRLPVIGVNFGRVGFLTSIAREELEQGLTRVFSGEYHVVELATVEVEVGGVRHVAVNDVVATSSTLGRMIELAWALDGEDLGLLACDGVICSTPSGSTAYNLSNGGPVLVWGLDAMAITFIAAHSLHARPVVVPRGRDLIVWNRTADVSVAVLADGHRLGDVGADDRIVVRLGEQRALLGVLPEATFFRRYRETFAT